MVDLVKLRAWWSHRQGLDGSLAGASPAEVLDRAGWARTVGGANPYLTLFARAGTSRAEAEAAQASLAIHELPSARGCTYLLPADDFALALTVGQGFGDEAQINTAKKFLGVTDDELDRLNAAVLEALGAGDKDPAGLRSELGDAVRNLGEAGKKRGLTTTLPLALGKLQSLGLIRRVSVDGRLDTQRYRYTRWDDGPFSGGDKLVTLEDPYVQLARRYFSWTGPAKVEHFRWFSGLGVTASNAALEALHLEDVGEGMLIAPADRDAWEAFEVPSSPQYALIAGLDSLVLLRRDAASLVDAPIGGVKRDVAGAALGSPDLENNAIVDRGRLVGLWEYDPAARSIVWATSEAPDEELRAAVLRTEMFIRDELEDARSMSLDSPKAREPRIKALRALGAS
jgi:hypothetical protein